MTATLKNKNYKRSQRGRSMVEMLGVLAIIGVLSVGGMAGYTYAKKRHNVNQTISDIQLLKVMALTQKEPTKIAQLSSLGYAMIYDPDDESIQLSYLPKDECKMLFKELTSEMIISVNGKQYDTYSDVCTESNELGFYIVMDKDDFVPNPCPVGTGQDGSGGYATTKEGVKCYCMQENTVYKSSACIDKPEKCKNNNECNKNEYCNLSVYTGEDCPSSTIISQFVGECRNAQNDMLSKPEGAPFYVSQNTMTWQSAKNLCTALNKTMVSISDWQCSQKICRTGTNCECKDGCACKNEDKTAVSDVIKQMGGYSSFNGWTSSQYSGCYYYSLNKSGGYVGSTEKTKLKRNAICK